MQNAHGASKTKDASEEAIKTQAQKDYEEGLEFLKKRENSMAANAFHNALVGFRQDTDQNGIANATDKLGDLCLADDQFEQALSHWQVTYDICEKEGDRHSLFSILRKQAKLYWQWQKLEKAINLYLDVIDEYSANNNPQGTVETLETLCEIYLEKGDKEKAADCLRTAAGIHKNFHHNNFHDRLMARAKEIDGQ